VYTVYSFFKHKDHWLRPVGVLLLVLASAVSGNPAEQGTADPSKTVGTPTPTTTPAAETIPLEEVATQAIQVDNLIRGFTTNLADTSQVETIEKFLPEVRANLALELKSTTNILKEQPAVETLQSQADIWQQRQLQLTGLLNVLTDRTRKLRVALTQLKKLQETWSRTRDGEEAAKAPDPILQQINRTLAAIQAAQIPYETQRDELLNLQSKITDELAICNAALAQISGLQQMDVGGLLMPQTPPIWAGDLGAGTETLSDRLLQVAAGYWADIVQYVRDPSRHMPRHVAIFIVLSVLLLGARRRLANDEAAGTRPEHGLVVFDHVFAGALLVTLMIVTEPGSPAPVTVKRLFQIAALAPIIILIRRVVAPVVIRTIYGLAILLVVDTFRRAIVGELPMDQRILALEAAIGIVVVGWPLIYGARSPAQSFDEARAPRRILAASIVFALCSGLVAAVFGYMRLARLAISGVLAGGALALELYASLQVAMGLVRYALREPPLNLLKLVQHHRDVLQRRIYRILLWLLAAGWLARNLDYLGLLEPAQSMTSELLNTRLERGSISISIGDIGAFLLTVLASHLLSSFIRFVLEEDVYPRTGIATGRSYAVSSLLNYTIIAVGFVLAIGFLGVDMTKMTVLAGAFGVGIGFGLQSIVNNFVSGLVLLFEHPIQVGDSVQVGNLQGRVRRIGIRASIIRTGQGAEIIVPNANLITQEVTNWTLSDELRRLNLPVGVNYGAAPKKLIELLEGVARAHPNVLKEPPPCCLFMSYGDSSINFELRVWTQYSDSQQVQSDLTVAIYDAIYAAGMSFPFPQREVRVLSDGNAAPKPRA
jgi:potassium-dependent mechanosensitive channel